MYSGYIQYNYICMYVYLHPEINSDDWSKTQWYSVFITEYQYKKIKYKMILLYQNKDHEVHFCVSAMNFHVIYTDSVYL